MGRQFEGCRYRSLSEAFITVKVYGKEVDLVKQDSSDALTGKLTSAKPPFRSSSDERAIITAVRLVSSSLEKVTNTNVLRSVKPPGKPKMLKRMK